MGGEKITLLDHQHGDNACVRMVGCSNRGEAALKERKGVLKIVTERFFLARFLLFALSVG